MCCKPNRRTGRMITLGEKIKKLRKDREITQEQLGVAVGVARQTISKWEADVMSPNIENIRSLSSFFAVDSSYFVDKTSDLQIEEAAVAEDCGRSKKNKIYLGLAIVFAVLGFIGAAVCVVLGFTVFSLSTGIGIQNTYGIDLWHFICAVIITVLFVAAGTTCFLLRFRKNK